MRNFFGKIILAGIVIVGLHMCTSSVLAASPLILVTWRAQTSAPQWFEGKILPVEGSKVTCAVELIGTEGIEKNKLIDLSQSEIRWYVDDDLVKKGIGMKTFSEISQNPFGIPLTGKVALEYTDPETKSKEFISKYFSIPIVQPEVVLETKRINTNTTIGEEIALFGHPFFFSAPLSELTGAWLINEQKKLFDVTSPSVLIKVGENIPNGEIRMKLTIENPRNKLEKSSTLMYFNVAQ